MPPRKKNTIEVDATEYHALVELRDVAHESLRLRLLAAEQRYAECIAINREQVDRLARQDLELAHSRGRESALRERLERLESVPTVTNITNVVEAAK